jgi:hypothetical protein
MSGRRSTVLARSLVVLQIVLLIAMLAPAGAFAADPSEDPGATPPPTEQPSAEPTTEPTSEPAAAPTVEPTPEPTATPTEAPTPAPTGEPTPQPTPAPTEAPAPTQEPAPTAGPTIASDLADYPPGGLVTLTGTGWQPGEVVHITVNDDAGSTWTRSVYVTAEADGRLTDAFNLPEWFVATYSVVAIGPDSGLATASFTDSNPQSVEVAAPTSATVAQGATAGYGAIKIVKGGNNNACQITLAATGLPAGATAIFGGNPVTMTNSDVTTSLSVSTTSSTPAGAYTFQVTGTNNAGGGCQGPGAGSSPDLTLTVTVSNVAPLVTLAAANDLTVDEGEQRTYSFTTSDPGEDTFALLSTDCGADGTQVGPDTFSTTTGAGSFVCSFPDGPASSTVSVQVEDADGADSNTATQTVAIANVAPIVTLTGALTADEGQTKTYSFTVVDPGADTFVLDDTSCGTGGSQVGADTFSTTTGAGSFVCSFPDGPASPTVSVTISDSDGAPDSDALMVTVSNVKPSIALTGDAAANEGQTKTYSFTVSDPGQDTHTITTACGLEGDKVSGSDAFVQATGLGSFQCFFPDGPATTNVTATVTDSDGASDTDSVGVTVANVAPVVTSVTIDLDPFTHVAIATATYTDPGDDQHDATFDWSHGTPSTTTKSASGGSVADSRILASGCYTLVVTVTITETDAPGASDHETATQTGADAYVVAFQAPIKDNERNIAKYGNVVPIKVHITSSCTGAAITDSPLFITIAEGNVGDVVPDTTPVIVAESVSNADSGTQMRLNGDGYIYNFSTKKLTAGKDYTIRIRVDDPSGSIIARALFQPKK